MRNEHENERDERRLSSTISDLLDEQPRFSHDGGKIVFVNEPQDFYERLLVSAICNVRPRDDSVSFAQFANAPVNIAQFRKTNTALAMMLILWRWYRLCKSASDVTAFHKQYQPDQHDFVLVLAKQKLFVLTGQNTIAKAKKNVLFSFCFCPKTKHKIVLVRYQRFSFCRNCPLMRRNASSCRRCTLAVARARGNLWRRFKQRRSVACK